MLGRDGNGNSTKLPRPASALTLGGVRENIIFKSLSMHGHVKV